jgi:serine/threonine-protein kinase
MLGQTIDGRYRIEARLARGGMATVYKAHDLRLDRPVAVKILHPHLAEGPRFIDRFRREARAAARLVDPGIVGVHDQGTWGEAPYLVMELVDGPNLRTLILSSGLPTVGKALDLMIQVLQALAVAHAAGFVHRDIKPENILISPAGQVKVADFGLARAVSEVTAASSGVVLGTVAYLSPELIAEGVADTRADVYAAGVVLFELLTGTQPFIAEAPIQVAFQHVHAEFPPPSSRVDWLPPEIDALVLAFTAKDPAQRPQDAAAALALIRPVRQALPAEIADRAPEPAATPFGLEGDFDQLPDAAVLLTPPGDARTVPGSGAAGVSGPGRGGESGANTAVAGAAGLGAGGAGLGAGTAGLGADGAGLGAGEAGLGTGGVGPPGADEGGFGSGGEPDGGAPRVVGWATWDDDTTDSVPTSLPGGGTGGTQALPLARIPPPAPPQATGAGKVRRRHRALWWVLAAVLLLGGGTGGGLYWYFEHGPGSLVRVPLVVDRPQEEAEQALTAVGLAARVEADFSDDVAEGQVMRASPEAGERVKPGAIVDLLVSKGVRQATVPASGIVEASVAAARRALADAGLDGEVTEELVFHTSVPEGAVIEVRPAGQTQVAHHQPITLVVSKGPEPVEVPDLSDMTVEEAENAVEDLDLTVETAEPEYSEEIAEGRIIRQDPPALQESHRGGTVSVVVSLGMPFVDVPKVVGDSYEDAAAKLDSAGLLVERRTPIGSVFGLVQAQDPAAGRSVRKGTTVVLTVV